MKPKYQDQKKQFQRHMRVNKKKSARQLALKQKRKKTLSKINKHVKQLEQQNIKEYLKTVRKKCFSKTIPSGPSTADVAIDQYISSPCKTLSNSTTNEIQENIEVNHVKSSSIKRKKTEKLKGVKKVASTKGGHCIFKFGSAAIVALKMNNKVFALHGFSKFSVLKGVCSLNGFKVYSGESLNFFAPVSHPALAVHVVNNHSDESFLQSILQEHGVCFDAFKEQFKELDNFDGLVLFEPIKIDFVPRILPDYKSIYSINFSHMVTSNQLCSNCWQCETSRFFFEYDFYSDAVETILAYNHTSSSEDKFGFIHKYPVNITVGGQNVGKSTLNRYIVNRLLERYPFIYYFECDVGQTEFTPSGFIAIHYVDKSCPLLGPPFTHQRSSKYLCFFGNTSPEGDPDHYIECVRFLFDQLKRDHNGVLDAPLIVNTNGWVKGMGSDLLMDIIHLVSPTHLIQIHTGKPAMDHRWKLNVGTLCTANGWKIKRGTEIRPYQYILLHPKLNTQNKIGFLSQNLRTISLLAYLAVMIEHCQSSQNLCLRNESMIGDLQAINPYCVYLPDILLCNSQCRPVKHKYVEAALNASIVGLCTAPTDLVERLKNPDGEVDLYRPPVCLSLGLGLVRGVDPKNHIAYIISDLTIDKIAKVNCLIRGDIKIPECLFREETSLKRAQQPYQSHNFLSDIFASSSFKPKKKLCR